jgi:hypothetical protein
MPDKLFHVPGTIIRSSVTTAQAPIVVATSDHWSMRVSTNACQPTSMSFLSAVTSANRRGASNIAGLGRRINCQH